MSEALDVATRVESEADAKVRECLEAKRSFALIAGAGSGKTTSLTDALDQIRSLHGAALRQNGQRVACITYTKRAVEVIRTRLGFDNLYSVSTLHSFLWGGFGRFHDDIRDALRNYRIPALIAKAQEKDNGGNSKEARRARDQVADLQAQLLELDSVTSFSYDDAAYSNYREGRLSHDDIIEVASFLLQMRPTFRRVLGLRFPYIFVDEAQDTFEGIVSGLNLVCAEGGLPLVGYFGDPWQQIYDGRAGGIEPPDGGQVITKTENFRCSKSVIKFLNAFRDDVEQYAAGANGQREGSVGLCLVQAEKPELPRKRYSEAQVERALERFDKCMEDWGWKGDSDVVQLFLVRQMIARRLGFPGTNRLFTGKYASMRAQEDYEAGEHFLLKPIIEAVWPLLVAYEGGDARGVIDLLRRNSIAFSIDGPNRDRSLREMIERSDGLLAELRERWKSGTVRDVFEFCRDSGALRVSEKLVAHLTRQPRAEKYDDEVHAVDKGDWLCDEFFAMGTSELPHYCDFVLKNTAYSTQHGVKGEEYEKVLTVFDDVEAAWSNYSFSKLLTPATSGDPTDGQRERGRKLAYVCFSRAVEHLRVVLFTPDPDSARAELLGRELLQDEQIKVLKL